MKVAYVTMDSPDDIRAWSGLNHYIGESVRRQGAEVINVGPLHHSETIGMRVMRRWYRMVGKNMLEEREPAIVKQWADEIEEKLEKIQPDIIFTTHTYYLSGVRTKLPIVVYCDANFASLLDFYPYYVDLPAKTIQQGHAWEKADLERADRVLYACDWAKDFAIREYGISRDKMDVIPFGANIECDRTDTDIEDYISRRPTDRCKLLFIGKVWERKGGDIAVAVAEELNRAGLPTTLTLMGSQPPEDKTLPDCVTKLGFINKDEPEGLKKFNDTIGESHFLVLPTRAEAFGIVFCEAASFGVPSLAAATGGTTTAVKNGANGQTFPLDASPKEYADYILDKFRDYSAYQEMGRKAFDDFQTRTNWAVSGKRIYDHLAAVIAERKSKG
jgi:glycosyltransferase involved in cell wall biosynthesis